MTPLRPLLTAVVAVLLTACGPPSSEKVRAESVRFRASVEKHRAEYLNSLDTANRMIPQSLGWLNGPALTASRAQAKVDAHEIMEGWARAHFGPRYMHEQIRLNEYETPQIQAAQQRLLDHLRRIYVEFHDYQRYCQSAARTGMHGAPPGILPKELQEFRARLEARPPATDELTPLLDSIPR